MKISCFHDFSFILLKKQRFRDFSCFVFDCFSHFLWLLHFAFCMIFFKISLQTFKLQILDPSFVFRQLTPILSVLRVYLVYLMFNQMFLNVCPTWFIYIYYVYINIYSHIIFIYIYIFVLIPFLHLIPFFKFFVRILWSKTERFWGMPTCVLTGEKTRFLTRNIPRTSGTRAHALKNSFIWKLWI